MGTACSVCGAFRVQHVAFALIPLICATYGADNIDRSDTFSRQLLKLVLQLLNCYTFRNVKEEMISLLLQKPGLYIWDVCVCVCVCKTSIHSFPTFLQQLKLSLSRVISVWPQIRDTLFDFQ